MCGIAGQQSLNLTPIPDLDRGLETMSRLIAHRGPDGLGQWQSVNRQERDLRLPWVVGNSTDKERSAYDSSSTGVGAPHTDFISIKSLKQFCSEFNSFEATLENISRELSFIHKSRDRLLNTSYPRVCGLDVCVTVTK